MKVYSTLLFVLLLLSTFTVWAQRGTLKGTIKDHSNGETLPGVNIYLLGTTYGGSADINGVYEITNIPEGTYKAVVSYISYKSDTISNVLIKGNKFTYKDFYLKQQIASLEGVTVVARRRSDSDLSMMSTIKQSALTINGVTSQQISRSQDKDAAEVVKRMPGITIMDDRFINVRGLNERYNSVIINNSTAPSTETDQRAFSFDVIPSNMIDNILVFKTPAPELQSDFAGALVQVFTKNYVDKASVGVSFQSGINEGTTFKDFKSYEGSSTDFLGFDSKTRQLPSAVPSVEEMMNLQDFSDGIDPEVIASRKARLTDVSQSFSDISKVKNGTALPDAKLSIDLLNSFDVGRSHISNISSVSYKLGNSSLQTERAAFEAYDEVKDSSKYVYHHIDNSYSTNVQIGALCNWSLEHGNNLFEFRNLFYQYGKSKTTLRNGVDYYRDGNLIKSYELGYMSRTIYSGQLSGKHQLGNDRKKFDWVVGFNIALKDEPDTRHIYTYATRYTDDLGNVAYTPYRLDYNSTVNTESNGRLFSYTDERIVNGQLTYNYIVPFESWKPEIKVGAYVENKGRTFDLRSFGVARAVPLSMFNSRLLTQSIDSVYWDENFNFSNGLKLEENTRPEYSYKAESRVIAGFVALKVPIGANLSVYGGARIESFHRKLYDFQDMSLLVRPNDIIKDTVNIYPSVNLTYNFTNRALIRMSYGVTVNRPEYREIAPYAFYDFDQSATVYGNDSLKDSYLQNYDARFEFYPSLGEVISLGAFYKSFSDPIELNLFPASNGWDFMAVNSVRGKSYGLELEIRKSFHRLDGVSVFAQFIRNLTFSFNGSLIWSEVEKDNEYVRDKKRALFGQSPYIINTGLLYESEKAGLGVNLLYNLVGPRIVIVGTPTIPNVYEQERHILDLVISKKLGKHWTLKAAGKDLFDSEVIYRQTFDVSINGVNEQRFQDIRKYKYGRSWYLTISYQF